MKKLKLILLLTIIILGLNIFISSATDPYARRIRPFTTVPSQCSENETGYSMSLHKFYICKNTGYVEILLAGSSSGANTALSNLASVAINTSLLPGTDNSIALGSSSKKYTQLFLTSGGGVSYGSGGSLNTATYTNGTGPKWHDANGGGDLQFDISGLNSTRTITWPNSSVVIPSSFSTLTNSAVANIVPVSNGTNLVNGSTLANVTLSNPTTINIDSGAGNTIIGDINGAGNGTKVIINDSTGNMDIRGAIRILNGGYIIPDDPTNGSQVGDNARPFTTFFLGNAATNNIQLIGTATGTRVATFPDKTGTVGILLSNTATLDFGNLATIGCEDLTITVTGAATGDTVSLSVPNSSIVANGYFPAPWVSAADTVTVRFCALVSGNPASGSFKVDVWKH